MGDPGLDFAAQEKHTFVKVPITEKELMPYLVKRGGYEDSISYYGYMSPDESLRWDLRVIDVYQDAASYARSKRN